MLITNNQSPALYTPCFNSQWFESLSSSVAQPNFTYTVKCTDLITSALSTYQIEQRPDSNLVFDASWFAKNYIKHYIPNKTYGWKVCTDAYRKIRVNVGHTFGSTPTYASGTNQDYYVWNSVNKYLDFPSYVYTDFIYEDLSLAPFTYNHKQLGRITTHKTFYDKSLYLYIIGGGSSIPGVQIDTYNAAGANIGSTQIANPYASTSNYYERFVCIDVGYKGLNNIASSLVTGTWPIINANVASYTVIDMSANASTLYKSVTIDCEPRYDVYTIHYLDRDGNFQTCNFSKASEITVGTDKTYYRQNPYTLSSNQWTYSDFSDNEKVINSSSTTRFKLNSDWYDEAAIAEYQYMISSPKAYLDMGSTIGLIPIKINTNSYLVNKKFNNKLWQLTIDIEYTHKDVFQNG